MYPCEAKSDASRYVVFINQHEYGVTSVRAERLHRYPSLPHERIVMASLNVGILFTHDPTLNLGSSEAGIARC